MDTLGTITPQLSGVTETEHRTEALERLKYLALSGNCGVVTGEPATGKSWCLSELAGQLRREGVSVAQINLAAVAAEELPWLIATRLGAGLSLTDSPIECWMWLQEHAESIRGIGQNIAFLIDHVDRAPDAVIAPLCRILDSYQGSSSWIFSTGDILTPAWKVFLDRHAWLRVELKRLSERETRQLLSRDLLQRGGELRFTTDGLEAAQRIAQGRIHRLKQLAELASIAAEADGVTQIDAETVEALSAEIV